jgi:Na+/melibiose symporter-like transporter
MEAVVAVFIPIVMFLVIGLILITYVYFRSRERQMLIEKGLSSEEIKQFFEQKKDPFTLLKIGIICIFFGLGLGFGMMLENNTHQDFWIPFLLFVGTGIGFVLANLAGSKLKEKSASA